MAENIADMLKKMLNNEDANTLTQKLSGVSKLLTDPGGQELMKKVKTADPEKLKNLLNQIDMSAAGRQLDDPERTLKNADPDKIRNLIDYLS